MDRAPRHPFVACGCDLRRARWSLAGDDDRRATVDAPDQGRAETVADRAFEEVAMSIRRVTAIVAGSALALALAATPALASGGPLARITYPATDLNADGGICGYTFTSGSVTEVYGTADAYPGQSRSAHITLDDVWATNGEASFHVVGSETYTDLGGRLTEKVSFVRPGSGRADSVNVVFRTWPDGSWHVALEHDSCHMYG
jgi:hypothetical protein